ncbi:unnamed protein product [marine sediment metagenome]|uniref:Uncharacterized protein n=1 Tax=marine sediment metagenome TaxID=412755 RepID=X1HJA1_9ZZZZ
MILEKSRQILNLNLKENGNKMPPDCRDAIQLGIEAEERLLDQRTALLPSEITLLPTETKD